MKTICNMIYGVLILFCMASCGPAKTLTVTVNGTPGTTIADPDQKQLAVIDDSGQAVVEVNPYKYYAFLWSKAPGSNVYVPFALDFKNNNKHATNSFCRGFGIALASIGVVLDITGTVMAICEVPAGVPLMLSGLGLSGAGIWMGITAENRLEYADVDGSFDYLIQQTNDDLFTDERKNIIVQPL